MPGSYYEEDEWHQERDYHRGSGYGYVQPRAPPPPPPPRRSGELFPPVDYSASSLRRSRSHGHSPAPNIYVYNRTDVAEQLARETSPARGRAPDRTGEIADRLGDIDRDIRRLSRSRGPEYRAPSASPYEALAMAEQLRLREADARIAAMEEARRLAQQDEIRRLAAQSEESRRAAHDYRDRERDEDLIRKKLELDRLRDRFRQDEESHKWEDREKALKAKLKLKELEDDMKKQLEDQQKKAERQRILLERDAEIAKAKSEREKLLAEYKLKEEEEEAERKQVIEAAKAKEAERKKKQEQEEKDAIARWEQKEHDKKEKQAQEEKDAIARWEQKQKDEKAKEEALKAKFKAEEEAKKRKEKQEEEEWRLKIKMKEEEEKEKKKKHEKELDDELHRKMAVFGFQENQIQAVLDPKKAKDLPTGYSPGHPRPVSTQLTVGHHHRATPTYIKISREHIDIETLRYYNLPYEIDTDPNYVIIMQEISEHDTNILFEHTRKLRRGSSTLLIEDRARGRAGEPQLAFVRRRRPSASPNRTRRDRSPIRVGLNLFG